MSAYTWYRVEGTGRDGRTIRYNDTHSERERDEQVALAQEHLQPPIGYVAVRQMDGVWGRQESTWFAARDDREAQAER